MQEDEKTVIQDLRNKLSEKNEEIEQWAHSYSNMQAHLIDLAKSIDGTIGIFEKYDSELEKEKFAYRRFVPFLKEVDIAIEKIILNLQAATHAIYPVNLSDNDSNELKIAVLLNELIKDYREHRNLAPKVRLKKLMISREFESEARERGLNIQVNNLAVVAEDRIITVVNTDKRDGKKQHSG